MHNVNNSYVQQYWLPTRVPKRNLNKINHFKESFKKN